MKENPYPQSYKIGPIVFWKESLATTSIFCPYVSCYAGLGQKIEVVARLSLLATLADELGVLVLYSHRAML
jgi:hypothetical protein